ncbi:MAG: phosphate ABC transporter permease PstA [Acetobacteraceae bacterium]
MSGATVSLPLRGGARLRWRRITSFLGVASSILAAGGVALVLILIVGYVIREGIGAISIDFLTEIPHPLGVSGGGVANGIVGSFIIVGMAALIAFPIGIMVGTYLSIHRNERWAATLRFLSDVLASVPSIAVGLFAYTLLVAPLHHFSAFSASFAFAVLMIPLVVRTTEGALLMVPGEMREAAIALGASEFQTVTRCLLVMARPGIVTGLILALARVTGETAPLLFTAFGSQFWEFHPGQPMAELSLQIFTYAISPYASWHQQAWGGALLLIFAVFLLSVMARSSLRRRPRAR